jgi:ABC-type bacteriocin/lantibiotic exporter with double-glycine peptidase domain
MQLLAASFTRRIHIFSPKRQHPKSQNQPSTPQLDKVSFTYRGASAPTLSDVHVMCRLSSRVAVVGANGAGKSTLIKVGAGGLLLAQIGLGFSAAAIA